MLFEEEILNTIVNFSAKTIYKWYIDGMFEYQIFTQLNVLLQPTFDGIRMFSYLKS